MFRNMVTSLFKHDRIRTTDAKAKELRGWADHVITLAKRGDLHARRQALAIIREKDVVHKLFAEAAGRFGKTSGGYTRVIKLGTRPGDSAAMSLIELVATDSRDKKKTAKKSKKAPSKKTTTKPEEKATEPAIEETQTLAEADDKPIDGAAAESVDETGTGDAAAGQTEVVADAPAAADEDETDSTASAKAAVKSAVSEDDTQSEAEIDAAQSDGETTIPKEKDE
jgi:large subunit ribosomal protein L17